jgi:hypothetical protein
MLKPMPKPPGFFTFDTKKLRAEAKKNKQGTEQWRDIPLHPAAQESAPLPNSYIAKPRSTPLTVIIPPDKHPKGTILFLSKKKSPISHVTLKPPYNPYHQTFTHHRLYNPYTQAFTNPTRPLILGKNRVR